MLKLKKTKLKMSQVKKVKIKIQKQMKLKMSQIKKVKIKKLMKI